MDATPIHVRQSVLPFLFALTIAGCSTTDYTEPVTDFAAATANAKTALSDLNIQVTDAYRGVPDEAILKGEVLLKPRRGECLAEGQPEHPVHRRQLTPRSTA